MTLGQTLKKRELYSGRAAARSDELLQTKPLLANLHGRTGAHAKSLRYHLDSLEVFGFEDTFSRLQVLNNVILVLIRSWLRSSPAWPGHATA